MAVVRATMLPLLLLILLAPFSIADEQTTALLQLKDSFANASGLSSWVPVASPCDPRAQWVGIICTMGFVVALRLDSMGLSGQPDLSSLRQFRRLRSLSLAGNSLSGPFPPTLLTVTSIRAIYLQGNRFSGPVPPDVFSKLTRLRKLWLAGNSFSDAIPVSISNAKGLVELRLEGNQFSGPIPDLVSIRVLRSFNVSHNKLEGKIPDNLSKFDASSFSNNPGLCGLQLANQPCNPPTMATATSPANATNNTTLSSASTTKLKTMDGSKILMFVMVIMIGCSVVAWGFTLFRNQKDDEDPDTLGHKQPSIKRTGPPPTAPSHYKASPIDHDDVESAEMPARGSAAGNAEELVMVNEGRGIITLTDLMKAAAELLGNGGLGSAYKAVLGNGVIVAVKRMQDMNRVGREGFEVEMRRLGRMNHPNVLPPLCYHYRRNEKLVVSEFMPRGSLLYVLHGDSGEDHATLNWLTRLKIIAGIARGVGYIHTELASLDIPHGNLKSGNVLIGPNFEPLLVDYGYTALSNPSQASQAMFAYRSPEALQHRSVSPKSDVYCLGIIILELITGKFPSQYLNNITGGTDVIQCAKSAVDNGREAELLDPTVTSAKPCISDMRRLVQVSLGCVDAEPNRRLDMKEAVSQVVETVGVAIEHLRHGITDGRHATKERDASHQRSSGSGAFVR